MMICSKSFGDILSENGIGMLFSIAASLTVAIITTFFLEKAFFKQRRIGAGLAKNGIEKVKAGDGKLSLCARHKLFGRYGFKSPNEIKLFFLSGNKFFNDYRNYLEEVVLKGTIVKVLLGNPFKTNIAKYFYDSENFTIDELQEKLKNSSDDIVNYYKNICEGKEKAQSFLERDQTILFFGDSKRKNENFENVIRKQILKCGDLVYQVFYIAAIAQAINDKARKVGSTGRIEIHYYDDEYRFPMILASYAGEKKRLFRKNKEYFYQRMWTNFNAPCIHSAESVNIYCKSKDDDQKNFLYEMENSFDFIYDRYTGI